MFIWGETDVMVPWRIVPSVLCQRMMGNDTGAGDFSPFLSSIVTVSLAHFMRNLHSG